MEPILLELEPWWMYLGFLSLQFLLVFAVDIGWTFARWWLDRRHPDNLPMTTAEWTRAQLAALDADDVEVIEASEKTGGVDAYHPSAVAITLTQETYAKNDPSFWAVGAHEIGHALAYRNSALFTLVARTARLLRETMVGVAATMMFANMWYRLPQVTAVGRVLFLAVLACDGVVMLDEARASWLGRKLLRKDPHLTPRMLMTTSLTLAAAFATYFGAFIGRLLLVFEWRIVSEAITRRGPYTPGPVLAGASLAAAGVLSAIVLGWGLHWGFRRFVARAPAATGLRAVGGGAIRGAFVLGMLGLVWDQPFGLVFVALCAAALYSGRITIFLVSLPLILPVLLGMVVIALLVVIVALGRIRRSAASESVGATDAPGSGVLWEAISVYAAWPMIAAFWFFWLTSR